MSACTDSLEYARQQALVAALLRGRGFPHTAKQVRLVETHISWVLLAGRYAYKIKKAVNLGFLDFCGLEARRFYCAEEIRLNRRLAPRIYLDVVPLGGSPEAPQLGVQPAIEYAVRMRRFATSKELDHLLACGKLTPHYMDELAALLADFHGGLPRAEATSAFGAPEAIRAAAMQNFQQLSGLLPELADCAVVATLKSATERAYAACEPDFRLRHALGWVRECHGDLHLGNIVLLGDRPVPFDGIEFSPALRWIDVIDEMAFLVMDLLRGARPDLAYRLLNAYLEATGDYAGVAVLRFYLAYRATVRAKVAAIRAFQPSRDELEQAQGVAACRSYLVLALECLVQRSPALIITHGLPGSGKTTFAQAALERLRAIRLRSDVERKRLFGLKPLEDSRSARGEGIYGAEATRRTYARLLELARGLLAAGFTVIVDAAFLRQDEREQFRALAERMAVPFAITSVQASPATLEARVARRRAAASDASEAGLDVLQMLQAAQQPLQAHELERTVTFSNDVDGGIFAAAASWSSLGALLKKR